jgi:hypothetical protein
LTSNTWTDGHHRVRLNTPAVPSAEKPGDLRRHMRLTCETSHVGRRQARDHFRSGLSTRLRLPLDEGSHPAQPLTSKRPIPSDYNPISLEIDDLRTRSTSFAPQNCPRSQENTAILVSVHYDGQGSMAGSRTIGSCFHRVPRPFDGILCASAV